MRVSVLIGMLCCSLCLVVSVLFLVTPATGTIGGSDADDDEAPYFVELRVHAHGGSKGKPAGGTLITNRHVLTAAHIFNGVSQHHGHFSVRVRNTGFFQAALQLRDVTVHPSFATRSNVSSAPDNDLAIITLPQPIIQYGLFKPVTLHIGKMDDLEGAIVNVYGIGRINMPILHSPYDNIPPQYPSALQVISKRVKSSSCENHWGQNLFSNDEQLCMKGSKTAICQGDSGSPIVHHNQLVGVVSWGNWSCHPMWPSVGTRVAPYVDWISLVTMNWSNNWTANFNLNQPL